uniref:Homeobox domain-containing protein n=1 Tax=Esox lucius TaxID=8010 RepID=A0AAY5LA02_ESOLU
MDSNKVSNFSIDHILGSEVGSSYPSGSQTSQHFGHLPGIFGHGLSNGHNIKWNYDRPLTTSHVQQVPTTSHTFDYTGSYLGYGSFHSQHADWYFSASYHRVPIDERVSYPLCTKMDQGGNLRNRGRLRTVFTDSQTKELEQLFDITDYPGVEARAELARNASLTEEIVRVWFKNRRARRKKQKSGTKAHSPFTATSKTDWTAVYNNRIFQGNNSGFLR